MYYGGNFDKELVLEIVNLDVIFEVKVDIIEEEVDEFVI